MSPLIWRQRGVVRKIYLEDGTLYPFCTMGLLRPRQTNIAVIRSKPKPLWRSAFKKRFCRNRALLLFFALTAMCWRSMRQTLNPVVAKVLKRLHYPLDVILLYVRWYSAYPLSLRNIE